MKITNLYIERTFNLGNYESLKIGFEATLNETDKPLEVTTDLENLCFQHYQNRKASSSQLKTQLVSPSHPLDKTEVAIENAKQVGQAKDAFGNNKTPAQLANENTEKRNQTSRDSSVCPKCGGFKKPGYELCYNCHEEEKAQ